LLIRRILTTLFILPLFLAALFWLPQRLWGLAMLAIVVIAALEWSRLVQHDPLGRSLFLALTVAACIALMFSTYALLELVLVAVAVAFWVIIVPPWLVGRLNASRLALSVAGWLVLVSAWYCLHSMQQSPGRLLALIAVVWIADTSAYFAGRQFGRHKLAPAISPGKTWEGVVGAVAVVGVYYGLVWWLIAPVSLLHYRLVDAFIVSAMLILSIEGDLFESWIKRRAGVKDSGRILPGHGGVLDRIDGLVAALPVAALPLTLGRI
jgi:phosphatidate cytidylyltransferase